MTTELLWPDYSTENISSTEEQCAFSAEVMSTELEVKVFLKRLRLFFETFCKRERKIISQYKGSIPYLLNSY